MKERVVSELSRIERENRVRILLAVESGSRAWGFASPDSDYDVRFIYVHDRDWYLSVFESRDVVEEMLPGKLDVSGWELRKTLRLFSKCNLALNEWLGSPILYHDAAGFRERLASMIPRYFNPIAATHHYRSMAVRALTENLADGRIPIKKLFYVLRPLLACRWILHTTSQPPTAFADLTVPDWVTSDEKIWISRLLREKSDSAEAQTIELDEGIASRILAELEGYKSEADLLPMNREPNYTELNRLLRDCVGGGVGEAV